MLNERKWVFLILAISKLFAHWPDNLMNNSISNIPTWADMKHPVQVNRQKLIAAMLFKSPHIDERKLYRFK